MVTERRTNARRPIFRIGELTFEDGRALVDCLVRDSSKAGALIEVRVTEGISDTFRLTVPSIGFQRDCKVVRRTAHLLGVAFAA
jgi:hypothetical protein